MRSNRHARLIAVAVLNFGFRYRQIPVLTNPLVCVVVAKLQIYFTLQPNKCKGSLQEGGEIEWQYTLLNGVRK